MMTMLLVIITLLAAVWLGLVAARLVAVQSWTRGLVAYAVTFPRGVSPEQLVAFLTGAAGMMTSRWRRLASVRALAWEVTATSEGIMHHLVVPDSCAEVVLAALRAALPGARTARDDEWRIPRPRVASLLGQVGPRLVLADGRAEAVSAALLSAMQPLSAGERIDVQWLLVPTAPSRGVPTQATRQSRSRPLAASIVGQLFGGPSWDQTTITQWRRKVATPVFVATGRIGATATTAGRARQLRARVLAALHTANEPGAHLVRSWWPSGWAAADLTERVLPLVRYPALLNAGELSGLLAVPMAEVVLPGLSVSGTHLLAPAAEIPSRGRIVAQATFPGAERSLALSVEDSLRHLHVLGPTGTGKSTLLLGLITQDMAAGRGVVVVDPKGDLVSDVLDRVPPERLDDVVVLDPTDEERPVGLNLLARPGDAPELVVDQVVSIFHDLYHDSWGPRTDDILRAALLTLVGVPGMTLAEVPLLLTDPGFRRPLVGRIEDPVALGPFWAWYEALSDAERAAAIGPVMNKLRTFLLRRRLRNMLGQAEPAFDFDWALEQRAIVLVPLSKGLLGEEAAALLGSLVVTRMWQAVQKRAAQPPQNRVTTFAYIDEVQDYLHLPSGVESILAQARALRLGLTLAHQHLGQLPTGVREAVMANTRSRMIFQLAAKDAGAVAKELAPFVKPADLQGLGRFEVVASLSAGSKVAAPVTGETLPPPAATGQAAAARERSRQRYGVARAEVEAAIQARYQALPRAAAVGRRRSS